MAPGPSRAGTGRAERGAPAPGRPPALRPPLPPPPPPPPLSRLGPPPPALARSLRPPRLPCRGRRAPGRPAPHPGRLPLRAAAAAAAASRERRGRSEPEVGRGAPRRAPSAAPPAAPAQAPSGRGRAPGGEDDVMLFGPRGPQLPKRLQNSLPLGAPLLLLRIRRSIPEPVLLRERRNEEERKMPPGPCLGVLLFGFPQKLEVGESEVLRHGKTEDRSLDP
ncbi:uncharacterized protein [Manis javanica]|uniref:uncharacterized protein n=1 Tax=Manis javanica TaxID=9974 RepID=UPI003C6D64E9